MTRRFRYVKARCVELRSGRLRRGWAVELCCDETRLGEVGRGLAVIVWRGVVRRGRLWRSNYNNSH